MPFPFQRLPTEIRHMIYALALCIPGEISPIGAGISGRWSRPFDPDKQLSIGVGLLQTCKEVELDAAPILYGGNKFLLTHDGAGDESAGTFPFLVKIGRRNRQALRKLIFHVYFCRPSAYKTYSGKPRALGDSFDLLVQAHNLHVLELRFVGTGIRHAYRQSFTVGLTIVAKMKKIKNVKQLVLKGTYSPPDSKIDGISPEAYIALLKEDTLVGKKVESPPIMQADDQAITKTVTERLAGLEKTLGELLSIRNDPMEKSEAVKAMMESIRLLQKSPLREA
ncbi:MAG: hypothetical protein FRX48_07799 [Lasallia pustulata]|uniref:Uncharacterized protein n=1 Tax=Lasallia pustulata TaxID=136370 RepID=A0A5M8PH34_9LECA|nr:MAG: hypothetical protein FRX48_07799 [Lasallia pustulata]